MRITPRFKTANDLLKAVCIELDMQEFEQKIGAIDYGYQKKVNTHGLSFTILRDYEGYYNLVVNT